MAAKRGKMTFGVGGSLKDSAINKKVGDTDKAEAEQVEPIQESTHNPGEPEVVNQVESEQHEKYEISNTESNNTPEQSQSKTIETIDTKVIRDTFTLPEKDHKLISKLQKRALSRAVNVNKSQIIRAGLQVLYKMDYVELAQIMRGIPVVTVGRKKKK